MGAAIAFGLLVIVLGVFLPDVLHALEELLLAFFSKATAFVNALPAAPADIHAIVR